MTDMTKYHVILGATHRLGTGAKQFVVHRFDVLAERPDMAVHLANEDLKRRADGPPDALEVVERRFDVLAGALETVGTLHVIPVQPSVTSEAPSAEVLGVEHSPYSPRTGHCVSLRVDPTTTWETLTSELEEAIREAGVESEAAEDLAEDLLEGDITATLRDRELTGHSDSDEYVIDANSFSHDEDRYRLLQDSNGGYYIVDWEECDVDESGYSYRDALFEVDAKPYYIHVKVNAGDQPRVTDYFLPHAPAPFVV